MTILELKLLDDGSVLVPFESADLRSWQQKHGVALTVTLTQVNAAAQADEQDQKGDKP